LLLEDRKFTPLATVFEIAQNTITLIAPSKTFNVPGLFCFAIIPNNELALNMQKLQTICGYMASLGLRAAQAAFVNAMTG
jgi:cystathionine beta-lyase